MPGHKPVEGDKVMLTLEGEKLVLQRDETSHATLVEENGRKVLVPPGAPPMAERAPISRLAPE